MADDLAEDLLASLVDRVLRLKEEEDSIKADIKEVYAEAKAHGFDKTRVGDVVTKLRKLEKDAAGEAEKEALRDLYFEAYQRAKNSAHTHAYARAAE